MSNWENFINAEDEIDPLIKCALAHYQFEAIHPFNDGNGRVGRILMVLFLIEQKLLSLPILYISGYINTNRSDYYRLLRAVSTDEKWNEFILFMLKGFHTQAKETKESLLKLIHLLKKTKERVKEKHKKIYTSDLVEALFAYPIITPVNLGKCLGIHYRTASRYLAELVKGKVLQEDYVGKYHLFINKPLMELLKG
ncbi:MAG: Fic family protein [bacterium]